LGISNLRKLRLLEEENMQLKKLVADLSLDKQMLQEVIKKSSSRIYSERNVWMVSGKLSSFYK
jgi:putative transposase